MTEVTDACMHKKYSCLRQLWNVLVDYIFSPFLLFSSEIDFLSLFSSFSFSSLSPFPPFPPSSPPCLPPSFHVFSGFVSPCLHLYIHILFRFHLSIFWEDIVGYRIFLFSFLIFLSQNAKIESKPKRPAELWTLVFRESLPWSTRDEWMEANYFLPPLFPL